MTRFIHKPLSILAGVWVTFAAILFWLALLISDLIVFPYRFIACAILFTVGLVACIIFVLVGRRWIAALFAVVGMLAVWQAARPWIDRHYVLANREPETVDVERHFVVGYDNIATIRELVRDAHIGGIFLTRRNVEGRTLTEVAAEIDGLQSIRREAGLPGLIVAADQEGGPVSHLSPPLPIPPALSSIAGLPLDKRFEAAEQLGVVQGSALREIGITMDLAPVCDLMPQSPPGIFDRHTRIAARSISDDPTIAAVIASGFSKGLLAMGVTPTAKHFPGLGRVTADTHLFSASLNTAEEDLLKTDWVPFRAVLDIPGAAVMLSHVSLDNVEFGVPASRSKRVITGILREQWGFRGVAISDDLTMGAAQHAGLCRAVEGAFNAGIDLLLVSWDADKIYPALRCGLDALNAGRLDRAMLKQSAQRLDQLKGR